MPNLHRVVSSIAQKEEGTMAYSSFGYGLLFHTLKDADVKTEDFKKFGFDTKIFNPYDPHYICKNHYVKLYFPWVNGACHWLVEDPWRYFYNPSRLNQLVIMDAEWEATLQVAPP